MNDLENDSDLFSSDTSEGDDFELEVIGTPRNKNENYLEETVPTYDRIVFFEHFRVSHQVAESISQKLQDSDQFKRHYGQFGKLSSYNQVLIFLWFAGHQTASFRDVGDRFNITISSVHRIIRRVTLFLSNLSPQIITWPEENEKLIIQEHFLNNGFPGIIGAIDGCHIKIDRPEIDSDSYINRKGYYSIQMQVVCDNQLKIRDVFVGYPGSVHDSRVFRNSPLCIHLEEKCGHYFILGDSGYPLQKNLLTPFRDRGQLNRQQINYNTKLSKNRYVIEHCFGVMKQKFRQLYHLKLRNIEIIVHFIRAMCVLHNIALKDDFAPNEDVVANDNVPGVPHDIGNGDEENYDDRDANRIRNGVANNLRI